jgi:hypothetical protein
MSIRSIIEAVPKFQQPQLRTASRAFLLAWGVILLVACATNKPVAYNPGHLSADQAAKIGQICQDVMGFKPTARLVDNAWPGDPDPATETNGYRGCIATLSRSFLQSAAANTESEADRACRAQGLSADSPALAECVLKRVQSTPASAYAQKVSLSVTPFDASQGAQSSESQRARRQQQACAEVGLEPESREFADCISGLDDVMTAMRLGKDYRN